MGSPKTHSHPEEKASPPRLALALFITLAFVFVEMLAGVYANSLALLTDAAHNFTDVIALALTWHAIQLASRPAHSAKTFGYHRAGILVALGNSTTLVLISLGIFYEAYQRLLLPPRVEENVLIVVAAIAFGVNAGTAWLVRQGSEHDLNVKSAFVHLAGDAVSTLGAVLAGIGIWLTGLQILDPLVSVLIGGLILWTAWGIIRETASILLESTPNDIDMSLIVKDLLEIDGVRGVHDLHAWSINQKMRVFSAHLLTEDIPISASLPIKKQASEVLFHKYGIVHSTLQLECAGCEPEVLYCDLADARDNHQCS
jgi:cobalt-zinc-cadmium efflux system protein